METGVVQPVERHAPQLFASNRMLIEIRCLARLANRIKAFTCRLLPSEAQFPLHLYASRPQFDRR
jgi:hypothetical protein